VACQGGACGLLPVFIVGSALMQFLRETICDCGQSIAVVSQAGRFQETSTGENGARMAMSNHPSMREEDKKVNVLLPTLANGNRRAAGAGLDEALDPEIENMPELAETTIKDLVSIFKLLSDETRLRILFYLTQRDELHVRALCTLLGQSQPAVSHHLALLRVAGLIEPRRSGKHNFYRLLPHRFQELLDTLFSSIPEHERRVRFENYVLSYSPVADAV
jgi:ArsR family transcriptional regulator, arsenate/arsenite/antimonite-responsive transcriptional repressor